MNIHKQLKTIRNLSGVTQEELSKRARCTQRQVSYIEGGKDCYVSTLRALLNAMGYDLVAVPLESGLEKQEGGKNDFRNQAM